uniref:Uncharacterized protein n=1 Tax=Anguilla anguilla TaxID=7936 RepID=A0A0E9TQ27_ANGAN
MNTAICNWWESNHYSEKVRETSTDMTVSCSSAAP